MAILGQISVDQLQILTVDTDPSVSGVSANIGSIAMLDNGVLGQMWVKSGAGNTAWSILPRLSSGTAFSTGSIIFSDASGFLSQNNSGFFWDNTNLRLGIGYNSPQSTIHVDKGTATGSGIRFTAGTTTGQTNGDGFAIGIDTAGNAIIRQYENSFLSFYTNNTVVGTFASTGQFLLGSSTTPIDITGLSVFPAFQILGTSAVQMAGIQYSADTIGPVFNLLKSRGASVGTQSLVSLDDEFGRIQFRASDGVNFQAGASIRGLVDGTAAAGSMPGRLIFMTTPSGSVTPVERMRISQNGLVRVVDALQRKRLITDFTSSATANTTTTLTSASNGVLIFTGTTAGQIVRLPDATTLTVGARYELYNTATATIALQDNVGTALETISTISGYAKVILLDNSTAAGVWQRQITFEDVTTLTSSTSLISTTNTTDTLMTGQTITPPAGTYLVSGRAAVSATTNNRLVSVSIYAGGSKATGSEAAGFIRTGNATFTSADISNIKTDAIVTVNGSQAIELRWRTSGGTAQAQGYGLFIKKLNN